MKLIRGGPGTGKTALVFREFKQALAAGKSEMRLVVPTATLVRHLQHELARDGFVFSPRLVVSLSRFIQERAAPLQQVPEGLLRAIVRDLLRPLDFPEFGEAAKTEGMTSTVIDTIQLFENAGCTPQKLGAIRRLSSHARAFHKIWRDVSQAVRDRGYGMRGDLVRAAAANSQPLRVWMDGFLAFSHIELELLRAVAQVCDLTLTLPDSPATDDIRRFALQLRAEDRLLSGASRKPQTTLIAARTLEREADEIARRILSLRDRGTPFRRIAVALRAGETYVPLLTGTFERFGIPARFYFNSALRKHPAAIFLGGVISGALNDWDFEAAITALRAHPRWGVSADFDRFEFSVREAMPGRGAETLLSLCEADWLRDEISGCQQTGAWRNDKLSPADWRQRFESLAVSLYRPGMLRLPGNQSDFETARSHTTALRCWLAAVASITSFWKNPSDAISLEEFWMVASQAIAGAVLDQVDDRADVVHVMSVYEARQWDVSSLFVCGMADRDFPKQPSPNLLFPDQEIDRLHAAGIPLRKASGQARDERWLFDSLITRAADSLFLSYPEHDAAGKSVQASRLLEFDRHPVEIARVCHPIPEFTAEPAGRSGRIFAQDLQAEMTRLHQTIGLTALEDLAQCRFKFFGARTLSLKGPPERPDERLQPRVTGSILHVALERWLADRNRDFLEVFEFAFDEACRQQHLPAGYRLEVERMQCREIARRVSANDLWTPDESWAEVELAIDFPGGVTVKCRVDRIDRFGADCVIVDYKSSKTANVEKLVSSRTRLQGPLYALAARDKLGLNPVAMIYWAVREDQRYGWGKIPGTDLVFAPMPASWAVDARARASDRLAGFLGGEVHAHPEETEPCRWCDFAAACRVEQPALVMIESARSA